MADDSKSSGFGADQIAAFIEKQGVATLLLLVGIYFGYTSFLKPASDKFMMMLDSVSESNVSLTETIATLREGMVLIGEKNTSIGERNAASLEDIETHLRELEAISRDIDSKLNELRTTRFPSMPAPAPAVTLE